MGGMMGAHMMNPYSMSMMYPHMLGMGMMGMGMNAMLNPLGYMGGMGGSMLNYMSAMNPFLMGPLGLGSPSMMGGYGTNGLTSQPQSNQISNNGIRARKLIAQPPQGKGGVPVDLEKALNELAVRDEIG